MDTVEIVISIEEAFAIEITDEIAASLETPAMVIDYIMAQQAAGIDISCPSMRVPNQLSNALTREGIAVSSTLPPTADLDAVLPRKGRNQLWKRLQDHHRIKLPPLERPTWLTISLILGISACSVTASIFLTNSMTLSLWMALILIILLGVFAYEITKPLAVRLPNNLRSLEHLTIHHKHHYPHLASSPGKLLTREQVAETVKEIITDYCSQKRYREDAHFIRDLGLD